MAAPWTTECRYTRPMERLFIKLSREQPTSAGDTQYLLMIVDDPRLLVARMALFLEENIRCSEGLLGFSGRHHRQEYSVHRGLSSFGQRHRLYTNSEFMAMLNPRGIHREYTPVGSPKHDGVVERRIDMTLKLAMASHLEAPPPTRRREDASDAAPLGCVMPVRERRDQHDIEHQRHAFAIPQVLRESPVCAAAAVDKTGFLT